MKNYTNNKNIVSKVESKIKEIIGMPYIKLNGNRQILIEGKCRIFDFDSSEISLFCDKTKIMISGNNLSISVLDNGAVVIEGKILVLSFDGE